MKRWKLNGRVSVCERWRNRKHKEETRGENGVEKEEKKERQKGTKKRRKEKKIMNHWESKPIRGKHLLPPSPPCHFSLSLSLAVWLFLSFSFTLSLLSRFLLSFFLYPSLDPRSNHSLINSLTAWNRAGPAREERVKAKGRHKENERKEVLKQSHRHTNRTVTAWFYCFSIIFLWCWFCLRRKWQRWSV